MIEQKIRAFLTETFKLPVVRDIGQTKVEQCISYHIERCEVNNTSTGEQSIAAELVVMYRAQAGYDQLGFMSYMLGKARSSDTVTLGSFSCVEEVDRDAATDSGRATIVAKRVQLKILIQRDVEKEIIKQINWDEDNG